jgi:hypothetical protein
MCAAVARAISDSSTGKAAKPDAAIPSRKAAPRKTRQSMGMGNLL